MSVDLALRELIRISNVTGKDTALVQGGGGNTSAKTADGRFMCIKASGTALKEMSPHKGWRRMELKGVLAMLGDAELGRMETFARENEIVRRLMLACKDEMPAGIRPSVEAHFHAMLGRYVIHLHPLAVGAYVNAKGGRKQIERLFRGEKYPPLWVPYTDPGYQLAQKMKRLIDAYQEEQGRKPALVFLEKHGLIVSAETAEAALRLVRKVIAICQSKIPAAKAVKLKPAGPAEIQAAQLSLRKAIFSITGQYLPVSYCFNEEAVRFMARPDAARLLAAGPLSPDEMVYANGPALWLERPDAKAIQLKIQKHLDTGQAIPRAYLMKNIGLLITCNPATTATIESIAAGFMLVREAATRFGGVWALSKRQRDFIRTWESESYREKLSRTASQGSLQGRIAVVTGAGSGLGRGIAIGLARAGAMVAACDLDRPAAEETVSLIRQEMPGAATAAITCNVTDETSVEQAYQTLLQSWGGLDILVNAAGVAPAYSLADLPVAKFRFALEVNLTGYFLMARAAARILMQQGMGGSIINLSSKSGLDASKNNTPYNATKAGEIHMARGWAMELGEYGIRVNSVCPGNVFEGSKIWNPEYIKVCAKKYGIKPEEVIPYYVNKTILKREIKRQDIADAVVFLCSDQARTITGQTLVADSGQVMVR